MYSNIFRPGSQSFCGKKEKAKLSGHMKDHALCSKIVTNDAHNLQLTHQNIGPLQTLALYKVSTKSARNGHKLYNW